MTALASEGFRVSGRHVLAALLLFFGVVIGLDVLFATLAYRTFSGQSAANPYEAGLLFNQVLARREAEAQLGWRAMLDQAPGAVVLRLTAADGAALQGMTVTGALVRPATERGRRALTFKATSSGYRADLSGLSGAWDLTAVASNAEGRSIEINRRIILP